MEFEEVIAEGEWEGKIRRKRKGRRVEFGSGWFELEEGKRKDGEEDWIRSKGKWEGNSWIIR